MSANEKKSEWAFGPFSVSLHKLQNHLLDSTISESEIVKLIKEMSEKFTKKREQISDYVFDDRHVSAYACFYLPTNIPKLHFLLSSLSITTLEDLKNRPFIDMGCGPGTFSLAWKMLMIIPSAGEIIGVDSSKLMLAQASKILNGFYPNESFKTFSKFNEKKSNSILFFGHSINEMGVNKALDHIMTIDPEYVIWIEPGTSDVFKEILKLRMSLKDHYDVLYPCPSFSECPNLWCHQVLRSSHEACIERLSQLVSLDRKVQPMIAHVYKRKSSGSFDNHSSTIIRFINETKFSFEYEICYFDHEKNKNSNVVIEIQKKQLTKDQIKHFKNAHVGERIFFEVEKIIGEKLRVRLTSA